MSEKKQLGKILLRQRALSPEELDRALTRARFRLEGIPWDAAFMAGLAFVSYRRRGGLRTSLFPDFFIGAHAAVRGYRLLTRDRGLYRSYFPSLMLTTPDPLA